VRNPALIDELAKAFGVRCGIAVDTRYTGTQNIAAFKWRPHPNR